MVLLGALVALVTLGVFFRYVVDASLSWYDEFASYLLVWLAFYGAVAGAHGNRHITFDTLVERMRPRARHRMALVSEACSLVFYATLFWYGLGLVRTIGHETAVSVQWIPMAVVYSALPAAGALMLLVSVSRLALIAGGHPLPESGRAGESASGE